MYFYGEIYTLQKDFMKRHNHTNIIRLFFVRRVLTPSSITSYSILYNFHFEFGELPFSTTDAAVPPSSLVVICK